MSEIVLQSTDVGKSSVEYEVDYSRGLRRFFDDSEFAITYDVDVSDTPPGVLTVPVLSQVCPVAWATDSTVRVDTVDRSFYESLRRVHDVLQRMYPAFIGEHDLRANEVVDQRPDPGSFDGEAQLFSGGVDSLATYVRHRDADPALIAIQGWVIGVDEDKRWQRAKRHVHEFADREDCDTHSITADISGFLDHTMLNVHYKHYTDGGWYSGVGHGLGLLGVCAPLAYSEEFETIHLGSTYWDGFSLDSLSWDGRGPPWGSHPEIDDNVRWAGSQGHHDAFDLTRQDKLELLADFIREEDREFVIRTCTYDQEGGNCDRCEKCVRTATGLLLAGIDPNEHGYSIDEEWFDYVIDRFEANDWSLDEHVQHYWEDIQAHLPPDHSIDQPGARAFFEWLPHNDFEANVEASNQPKHIELMRIGARHAPYELYEWFYPVYRRFRSVPFQ